MSGSALADAAGVGKVMIPAMTRQGYDPAFSAALTASASTIGPIFPPSIPMIVYGAITGVSVGALLPGRGGAGVLVALALMLYCVFAVRRMHLTETREPFSWRELLRATRAAILPLLTPGDHPQRHLRRHHDPHRSRRHRLLLRRLHRRGGVPHAGCAAILACGISSMKGTAAVMILLGLAAVLGWMVTFEGVARDFVALMRGTDPIVGHPAHQPACCWWWGCSWTPPPRCWCSCRCWRRWPPRWASRPCSSG
jgi:TRAP-type C4-dicarboxylate transport system permease large subunit